MSQEIKPKFCGYNCGTKIYWNTNENMYVELMTKKKHICPNRKDKPKTEPKQYTYTHKDGKGFSTYPPAKEYEKPKMANSFEHLQGSPRSIRKRYEKLSELIRDAGGKVHGSQRGLDAENMIDILVYYEVPELTLLGVQQKFNDYANGDLD